MRKNDLKNNSSKLPTQQTADETTKAIDDLIHEHCILHTVVRYGDIEDFAQKLESTKKKTTRLLESLKDKEAIQALLAIQIKTIYNLQQDIYPYAMKFSAYPKEALCFVNSLAKLSNILIQQINLMHKMDKPNDQKLIVEHVHVHSGGKAAIVGSILTNGETANEKS